MPTLCFIHKTHDPRCDACRHAEIMNALTGLSVLLQTVDQKLDRINQKENQMSAELDALTAEVTAEETVEQSAITLINGLAAKIDAAKNDPAAIAALSASIKAQSDQLAAAVTANTPVAPPAVPSTTGA